MADPVDYDEFGLFHENAEEYGLPFDHPPTVRRVFAEVSPARRLSALAWQDEDPELVLLHGGSQNAHTWDTVAMALGRPLVAIDLPGHGHSDGPGDRTGGQLDASGNAVDVAAAVRQLAPSARAVIGMSLGGLTAIALSAEAPEVVRKLVLIDVLPGLKAQRAQHITDFVGGSASFASLDELLERTAAFNPGRSRSALRRGILHNAEQQADGTWVWRWARHRGPGQPSPRVTQHRGRRHSLRAAMVGVVSYHRARTPCPGHEARLGAGRRRRVRAAPPTAARPGHSRSESWPQRAGRCTAGACRDHHSGPGHPRDRRHPARRVGVLARRGAL